MAEMVMTHDFLGRVLDRRNPIAVLLLSVAFGKNKMNDTKIKMIPIARDGFPVALSMLHLILDTKHLWSFKGVATFPGLLLPRLDFAW